MQNGAVEADTGAPEAPAPPDKEEEDAGPKKPSKRRRGAAKAGAKRQAHSTKLGERFLGLFAPVRFQLRSRVDQAEAEHGMVPEYILTAAVELVNRSNRLYEEAEKIMSGDASSTTDDMVKNTVQEASRLVNSISVQLREGEQFRAGSEP